MLRREFDRAWEQLRAKKPQVSTFLEEVRIEALRGIGRLRVPLTYPVSVLAGPNACGKSTVLFALACAYENTEKTLREFGPSTMFPDFKSTVPEMPSDRQPDAALEFDFLHESKRQSMRLARGKKGWNRSFQGRKGGKQPRRQVYLRTLANLGNPSEVRSVLQLGQRSPKKEVLTADYIALAQRILPFRYHELVLISAKKKDVLFAQREGGSGAAYSEFHMSAGERAILRLSNDLSHLQGALVLIDEVEAGLHPYTQQILMLEVQRAALRNDLQVIVTTHSSVVLESVPPEGRIFLERKETDDSVEVVPPQRDLIQKALYGRSLDKLSVLCEDEQAEGLILGVLDVLNPQLNLAHSDVEVGRDAGKDEFPSHVRALAKFQNLASFLFVLDGDGRSKQPDMEAAARASGKAVRLLFLPGTEGPEAWLWSVLSSRSSELAERLGRSSGDLESLVRKIHQIYENATDKPSNIAKARIKQLADDLRQPPSQLGRVVASFEAGRPGSEMSQFMDDLRREIETWRTLG